ncbi:acid protease [Cubamyces sp. BRFM 1775]|nr:acid protease [Cubamyces sp. BRFM 1775]
MRTSSQFVQPRRCRHYRLQTFRPSEDGKTANQQPESDRSSLSCTDPHRLHIEIMSPSKFSLFSSLLLVLSYAIVAQAIPATKAVDDSLISLSIAKRFNLTGSANVVARDQARARGLRAQAIARGTGTKPLSPSPAEPTSISATNELLYYVVDVEIGIPPITYELIVDTGTANTWVGAGRTFIQSQKTRQTRDTVLVDYGAGEYMSGVEFTDRVQLGGPSQGLIIMGQSFGVASEWSGFEGVDGVLGLGPAVLTIGTLSPDSTASIPTVTDGLFSRGYIGANVFSVYFQPSSTGDPITGQLTFGGTGMYGAVGPVNYAPITSIESSSDFWGINQGLRYGASSQLLSSNPGIFDSRTTMILLASDVFAKYIDLVGAVPAPEAPGFYKITVDQYANLQSLFFTIHNVLYEFTANAQIWPRNLNNVIGGMPGWCYLVLGDITWDSGSGMDFINGMTFIERYYMVFDTDNSRVGIANTPYTRATTN